MDIYSEIRRFIDAGNKSFSDLTPSEKRNLFTIALQDTENFDPWDLLISYEHKGANIIDYLRWAHLNIISGKEMVNKTLDEAIERNKTKFEQMFEVELREFNLAIKMSQYNMNLMELVI